MPTNQFIDTTFKNWCKETKRSGGVLTGQSLKEWHEYLGSKMEEREKEEARLFLLLRTNLMIYKDDSFEVLWERFKKLKFK